MVNPSQRRLNSGRVDECRRGAAPCGEHGHQPRQAGRHHCQKACTTELRGPARPGDAGQPIKGVRFQGVVRDQLARGRCRLRLALATTNRGRYRAEPPHGRHVCFALGQVRLPDTGAHEAAGRALANQHLPGGAQEAGRRAPGDTTVSGQWRHGPCNHSGDTTVSGQWRH